ncbi:ABC transporter permease [Paenibacillus sp. GCM10023248]|uniref:ABC transporter permease n=1 Tax=unclassified Paenibacillus TaxID=185978 RepID=UPI00237964DD|nr:ABC transporter permease subunit [Paenibacillus sp. MAHUQ-63]MDD9265467.1 ABC transporter permease subunit [Paenibacillus sp. MAHUQ-63]
MRNERLPLHLMLMPSLAILAVYSYWPMAGIIIAFEKYIPTKGIFGSPWIGWRNFNYLFDLPDTERAIINTLLIASMKIALGLIVPMIIALLLNEVRKTAFKRTFQTLVYLPHFLSWVILGGILIDVLSPSHGIVNQILSMFGIKPIFFLGENGWFRFVLVSSDVWKEFGFNTIVYLAALTGINPSLYEAAEIDGANRLQQTLYVTVPGIMPIAILMVTLSIGNVLNAGFDQIFNLYSPPVYESGDIIDTLVYRLGILQAQYGLATAVGLLKSTVSLFLISASYYLAYRFANYRIF